MPGVIEGHKGKKTEKPKCWYFEPTIVFKRVK
jgi:hypothetical protein